MKEKYTQFASVALAVVALFVAVVALMQVDNAPVAEQPQARGTTYFGNLSASGTMNADGATTLNSTLDVDGNVSSGTGSFTVTDSANITGAVDFDSTMIVDGASTLGGAVTVNNNATVTGTFAAGGATTLSGATTVNNNLIVTGTGRVDGAVNLNSTVDIDGNITSGTGAVTITDQLNVGVDGTSYDVIFYSDTAGDYFRWDQSAEGLVITGTNAQNAFTVADGNALFADNVDITGTLQFGADNLYALGHASSGKQIVCGTTGTFTDSTDLGITALTTIDGIVVTQITQPITTGAWLYVSAVSGYTATIKSIEGDFSVGTTGVNAYYCAVGNQ